MLSPYFDAILRRSIAPALLEIAIGGFPRTRTLKGAATCRLPIVEKPWTISA